jgi:hypothetical protein
MAKDQFPPLWALVGCLCGRHSAAHQMLAHFPRLRQEDGDLQEMEARVCFAAVSARFAMWQIQHGAGENFAFVRPFSIPPGGASMCIFVAKVHLLTDHRIPSVS